MVRGGALETGYRRGHFKRRVAYAVTLQALCLNDRASDRGMGVMVVVGISQHSRK
jgi:hypothetical protein